MRSFLFRAESFLHRQNLEKMATFKVDGGGSEGVPKRQCCYIKGSVHQNHLDIPFVLKVCIQDLDVHL